jgi:predicted ester cyclase
MFRLACPDMRSTVEDMIAEGDKVVDRLTWHAPHQGEFMGILPTGRAVRQAHMHFVRFRDGKAIEH